jgi:hypothetical protein
LKELVALLLEVWIEFDRASQFGRRFKIGSEGIGLATGKADDFG